jgi:hypothetical protein
MGYDPREGHLDTRRLTACTSHIIPPPALHTTTSFLPILLFDISFFPAALFRLLFDFLDTTGDRREATFYGLYIVYIVGPEFRQWR